jgi:hypothetical protein
MVLNLEASLAVSSSNGFDLKKRFNLRNGVSSKFQERNASKKATAKLTGSATAGYRSK